MHDRLAGGALAEASADGFAGDLASGGGVAGPSPRERGRLRRAGATALLLALIAGGPVPARADTHDPERAAHPVRIAGYILHPIGVLLDVLIVRPAHWVVEREPFRTLFGHEG